MPRKISFSEDNLSTIKNLVVEDVSLAELDEYEIGSEGSANDYFHVVKKGDNVSENFEVEIKPSEVDLSSFRKEDSLAPRIWDGMTINPRVRLKLLDIADDFWKTVGTDWVSMSGVILTGSICNYNWSKFSDIDLHIIVDFNKVDDRTDFVQEYYDSKKNEWNNEHDNLSIFGYTVEIYVENIDADTKSGGVYDLEENDWIRKPDKADIHSIGLDKYEIKHKSAGIMTRIDDYADKIESYDDKHMVDEVCGKADKLILKIYDMRKFGLERGGESDPLNIVFKVVKRSGYLDKLWDISVKAYDKVNSIDEGVNYDRFRSSSSLRYRIVHMMAKDGYLFHGTDGEYDTFDQSKIRGGSRGAYGYGAYFTNEAYKCEEYGNNFIIVDSKGINFIDINDEIKYYNNIFSNAFNEYNKAKNALEYVRNIEEYDFYQSVIDNFNDRVDKDLLFKVIEYIDKNDGVTYREVNANVGGYYDISERISKLYLDLGIDGFICDNQFVIFNFEKLNSNIVKDKEGLISSYCEKCINSVSENRKINILESQGNADFFELAKKYFGTTYDIRECGYVLPDGSMLDFSGRHSIGDSGDSSFLNGRRTYDHRDIYSIGWSDDGNTKNFDCSMSDFIKAGAIRVSVTRQYSYINLFTPPTREQMPVIRRIAGYSNGCLDVEIGDGDSSECYAEYDDANTRLIIGQINRYFTEGIKLTGNVNESLNEEVVADGNADHNVYAKRWKEERERLKSFILNNGRIMTSMENGDRYMTFALNELSSLMGGNYCLCVKYDPNTMDVGTTIYVRAVDKFTEREFSAEFDTRGRDNNSLTAY